MPAHLPQAVRRLSDPAGVIAHRPGALERIALLLGDWDQTRRRQADAQTRMTAGLGRLAPRERLVGNTTGRTRLTGQGRPALRLAAWRAVWGAQSNTPV